MNERQTRAAIPYKIFTEDKTAFLLLGTAALLLLVTAFYGGLAELVRRWSVEEEYSHAFFIPLIVLWLLWSRRDAITNSIAKPSPLAWPFFALAILFLVIGELAALFLLLHLGFLLAILAFVLAYGGLPLLKVTWVPLLYLLFAIPVPYFLEANLTWRLQIISSDLGVSFLRVFDIPVFLEGNVIDLGIYKVQVVEACSGLRYLYPLMGIGALAAYLFQAPLFWRLILFSSTIPITILFNSLRIAAVGFSVTLWGTEAAEGVLHAFEGWVIFMACALMLALEMWLIARLIFKKPLFDVFYLATVLPVYSDSKNNPKSNPGNRPIRHFAGLTFVLTLIVSGLIFMGERTEKIPERKSFAAFPKAINNWIAQPEFLDAVVESQLKVDDYVFGNFSNPDITVPVNLYVAFYASQRKGISPHSPRVCIPTGGWQIADIIRKSLTVESASGKKLTVNRVVISRTKQKQLVYYWFRGRGRDIADEYVMKWFLLFDAVTMNRTDGALVRLTTPILNEDDINSAELRIESLLRDILPVLDEFVPDHLPPNEQIMATIL